MTRSLFRTETSSPQTLPSDQLVTRRVIALGATAGAASLWLAGCSGSDFGALGGPGTGGAPGTGGGSTGGASNTGGNTGGASDTGGAAGANGTGGSGEAGAADDAGADDAGGGRIEAGNPQGMVDGGTPACLDGPTDDNDEGPFYRPNAPMRSVLAKPGDGEWLILTGVVQNTKCDYLANTLLDVWQSDGVDGMSHYDNTSSAYLFRGRLRADAGGAYKIETVLPGHYLNGDTLRVRHIHFIVTQDGHKSLTTQAEFQGDPAAKDDPISKSTLAVPLTKVDGIWRATFNIVLVPGKMTRAPEPRPKSPSMLTRRSFFGAGRWT
jgi:Dioxygenase